MRFSPRPGAAECDSNRTQFQRIRAYAKANDYQVVSARWDRDLSGGRSDNRPGLARALADAKRHKAVLIVFKFNRMARNTEDMLRMVRELREAGADFASVVQQVNTRGYTGKLFLTILAAFDEMEREATAEHTAIAMRQHQANGRRMGRVDRCPYGKQPDASGPQIKGRDDAMRPARLIDHAAELATLDRIRRMAAEGMGARAITNWLNDQAIPCRGRRWHLTTVRRLLKKIVAPAGKHNDEPKSSGEKWHSLKKSEEIPEKNCNQIIPSNDGINDCEGVKHHADSTPTAETEDGFFR
jgi:DNA invertase Pin-like site-specific DNA recombinase